MSVDLQDLVQRKLNDLVKSGPERGVQIAVYRDGHLVIDAWAGNASERPGDVMTGETLVPVFSTTKGIAATVLHRLVERGKIAYETPIANVWPEFATHGKGRITLRHALSHSAGFPAMPQGLGYRELCDWDSMCAAIAGLAPSEEPGSRTEYHAMTYGWIVGEAARRVDGRPFGQLVQEEICQPLGIKTLYVGLPDSAAKNVATLEETPAIAEPIDDSQPQAVPGWIGPLHAMMNRADVRRACIPSSNGIMNARAIAAHYAALLPGGCEGVRLLTDERVRLATEVQSPAAPSWGLGYQLGGTDLHYLESRGAFGHGGYGGSMGLADRELNLAIGITKNRFAGDDGLRSIVEEIRRVVRQSNFERPTSNFEHRSPIRS